MLKGRDRSGRPPRTPAGWLFTALPLALTGVLALLAVGHLAGASLYLAYLATRATVFDLWGALSIASAALSLAALLGAGFALWRRRFALAVLVAALTLPVPLMIEGSRCDTADLCRLAGWARLPDGAFDWSVRIRPVTDANEAEMIASAALWESGSRDGPFQTRRFPDHWLVSTINDDGWAGAQAVSIDTRTGRASLIACPEDLIRCGMDRPVVSDGRRAFRNDELGLAVVFPATLPVCTLRNEDDEAVGFSAIMRDPDIPCDVLDKVRQMGVGLVTHQLRGCVVPEAPSLGWRPLSAETAALFESGTLEVDGRPAWGCELRLGDDIEIRAYVAAAPPSDTAAEILYEAYVVTTSPNLAEDVRVFEGLLDNVRIAPR